MAISYDQSYADWMAEQVDHLRCKRFDQLDLENLIGELIDLGEASFDAIESHLPALLTHLLKLDYTRGSTYPMAHWRGEVREFRRRINQEINRNARRYSQRSASRLRERIPGLIAELYPDARLNAIAGLEDYGDPYDLIPDVCPWTVEQVLDPEFWPNP